MNYNNRSPFTFVTHPTKAQIEVVEKWIATILNIPNKQKNIKLRDRKLKEYNQVTYWLWIKKEYNFETKEPETVGKYKK
jgi:predicted dithiol-disulfide oxidoreductase (DUF899 family)